VSVVEEFKVDSDFAIGIGTTSLERLLSVMLLIAIGVEPLSFGDKGPL